MNTSLKARRDPVCRGDCECSQLARAEGFDQGVRRGGWMVGAHLEHVVRFSAALPQGIRWWCSYPGTALLEPWLWRCGVEVLSQCSYLYQACH